MKFEKDGLKFEVNNLTHVVINDVVRIIKPAVVNGKHVRPARITKADTQDNGEKGTRVWVRLMSSKGRVRWAKFRFMGKIPEDIPPTTYHQWNIADAEEFASQAEMQKTLYHAMHRPNVHLGFSGTYCNIKITKNYAEVQRIKALEENRKKKARQPKKPRKDDIMDALRYAISAAGAQVRHKSISTPFGIIPVMTISGSGKRDLLREMEHITNTGTFVPLADATKQLKIPRTKR